MLKAFFGFFAIVLGLSLAPATSHADWQYLNNQYWEASGDAVQVRLYGSACKVSFIDVPAELQSVREKGVVILTYNGPTSFRGSLGTNGPTFRGGLYFAPLTQYQFEVEFTPSTLNKNIFFVMDEKTNPADRQAICDGLASDIVAELQVVP